MECKVILSIIAVVLSLIFTPMTVFAGNSTQDQLDYQIIGGIVLDVITDSNANSLIFTIHSTSDGKLTITIPRHILDARIGDKTRDFIVLVDGQTVPFNETVSSSARTLSIPFPHGTQSIEIIGTHLGSSPTSPDVKISVFTNKSTYYENDTIEISGKVSEILSGIQIALLINNPDDESVSIDQIDVLPDKTFSEILRAGGPLFKINGIYTIKVSYGIQSPVTAQTTFEYVGSPEPTQSTIKKATKLTLDPIPSEIHENESITFSGRLLTDNQEPVSGVLVYIKDDDTLGPDDDITFALTGSLGWFTVDIPAKDWDSSSGGASEVYAEFKGDLNYLKSQTARQQITIYQTFEREPTKIILEQLPESSYFVGNTIVFSGKLTSFDNPVAHQTIKIKEDDPFFPDSKLVSGLTDSSGGFRIIWDIDRASIEREWEIYAKYDGNQRYGSSDSTRITPIITSPPLRIILDPIPTIANLGETIEFSGRVVTSGPIPIGQRIVLIDEDWGNWDDNLANAVIDSSGNFRVQWVVQEKDSEDRKFLAFIADFFTYGVASEANELLNSAEIGTVEVYAKFYDEDSLYKEEDSPIQILVLQTSDQRNEMLLGLLSGQNKQQNTDLLLQLFEGEDISEQQLNDLLTIMLEEKISQNNKIPTSQLTDLHDNDTEPLETMIRELSRDQTIPSIASFVDPNQDPEYYVNRYDNDPSYKEWFDENFPEYDSIYEAVGLKEPEATPKIKLAPLPPVPSPEPAPKIKPTSEPKSIPKIKPVPESEPILPTSKSQKVYPCGEGTHEESGKCIPDSNSDWQIFENIQNWFNENIVKPIMSAF